MSDNPSQPDKADQPHPKREITTTKAWNGTRNRHQTYNSISANVQDARDRHLDFIYEHWQTRDPDDFFPATLRPNGLPAAPRDYCTEMLEAFAALARLTRGDLPRALRFLRQAPADRGGWRGANVGVKEVWRACVLVEIDEKGGKASKEQAGKAHQGGSTSTAADSGGSTNEAPAHDQAEGATTTQHRKPARARIDQRLPPLTAANDTTLEGAIGTLQALTIADNGEIRSEKDAAAPRKVQSAAVRRSFSMCATLFRILAWVLVVGVLGFFLVLCMVYMEMRNEAIMSSRD